jgi:glutaconate CoA-transferase subunit A
MQKKLTTLSDAIGIIKNGDCVALGGVGRNKVPFKAVIEIIRQNKKNLFIIGREKGIDFDILIGAEVATKVSAAYIGLEEFGLALNFRKKVESGEIEFLEHTCGSVISGFRAGAMGIPFIPIKGLYGSDLLEVREDFKEINCPITGEKLVAVPGINPDVAIIHAQESDEYGNVRIRGSKFEDELMVKSANKAIVTVEKIISHDEIRNNPDLTTIPYFYVDKVVELPKGAYPTSCYGYYPSEPSEIAKYAKAIKNKDTFKEYIDILINS